MKKNFAWLLGLVAGEALLYFWGQHVLMFYSIFLVVTFLLAKICGTYLYKVWKGEKVFLSPVVAPVERGVYRFIGVNPQEEMGPKKYTKSVLIFSGIGLLFLFLLLMLQGVLPFNQAGKSGFQWHEAFNIAVSFITNTNWQNYAGAENMTNVTQMLGMTLQNFASAAVGLCVFFALLRGIVRKEQKGIGNFWQDLIRIILYVLIPISLVLAIIFMSQGVVQTFTESVTIQGIENGAKQTIPLGPVASQLAIKLLGTNGGGFYAANSAFPFENPTAISNILGMFAMLLLPIAGVFAFGKAVKEEKQGRTLLWVMGVLFSICLIGITLAEMYLGGGPEGKELLFGTSGTSLWTTIATATSTGATNSSLASLTPLGSFVPMFLMQLGEIVFGGVGTGFYSIFSFVLLTVFIAGLMVGRTPEYLGKKVEPYDMKMASLTLLVPTVFTLLATAVTVMQPAIMEWLSRDGAGAFSEVLYNFTSMSANNGSSMNGFAVNTPFVNLVGGLTMLVTRFLPMIAMLFLASNFARKKSVAASSGTLSTTSPLFIILLLGVILVIGALSYLPALALGPIADFLHP